jgi:hypothetical protein
VVIITGGYLCARIFVSKASGEVLLFVVYHQVDGDTTNTKLCLHIYFLLFYFWY